MVRYLPALFIALLAASSSVSARDLKADQLFSLRSDPWVNLHHFLYHEARNTIRGQERLRGRVASNPEDREVELSADESAVWDSALQAYAEVGADDLLFTRSLLEIGKTAARGPDAFPEGPEAPKLYQALRVAMPVFEKHWWPRHDAINQARIEELSGYLKQYGVAMAERLVEAYAAPWPDEPVLVDVTQYSGRHGAYATGDPNHVVFASGPSWYPGLLALDVLFHEVGHTVPFSNQVYPRSMAAAEQAGVDEGNVWHAFLFYVPSAAAREVLPESHTPYAYYNDGPLVDGRMAQAEPFIRDALATADNLDELFKLIHEARAAAAGE